MEMPVKSKVDEISLRPYEFLLPLFEVIVNAIISIGNKTNKNKGLITIEIDRDTKLGLFDSSLMVDKDGQILPSQISKIVVRDNGIGFNDKNFQSFSTAYSPLYKDKGCKGVGRFTMLACFQEVIIESVYQANGKQWSREFTFDVEKEVFPKNGNPIQNVTLKPAETVVILNNYRPIFKPKSAISTRDIAEAIIDHCLPFFLNANAPTVIVKDPALSKEIILNDILKEVIKYDGKTSSIDPIKNGTKFNLHVLKRSDGKMNRLRLCAHNRVVGKTKNLASLAGEFEQPMEDDNGDSYYIDVYVTSAFFDNSVNAVRNSFNIADEVDENSLHTEISINQIEKSVTEDLFKRYHRVIERLEQETLKKVRKFILDPKRMRIRYRALLGRPDLLRKIPYNASPDKIEENLVRIKIQLEKELTLNLKKALKKTKPEDFTQYSEIVKNYIDQEAKFAKDKLADLIIHRRGVLNLIKRLLKLSKDGTYALEEDLHNVIFPMGTDTDSLPFEYHNLWLLDERLAFHSYVASDKKLSSNPHVNLSSKKEADLLIFDFPWAFSEKEKELASMVVFEFKRPGRSFDSSEERKLDNLVMKYFEDLMADKTRDSSGELLNLEDTTPKFGFIICDLDKGLIEYNIKFNEFRKTPNGTLYKIIQPLNLHIEAMSYQQMISMSEKKHLAFFRELGIDDEEQ